MDPYEPPKDRLATKDSTRGKKAAGRITLVEVLIVVAIIAALVAWLPIEWKR